MNFNIPKDIPGNLAGGIGKDQLACPAGAQPSPFNDERKAAGTAKVARASDAGPRGLALRPPMSETTCGTSPRSAASPSLRVAAPPSMAAERRSARRSCPPRRSRSSAPRSAWGRSARRQRPGRRSGSRAASMASRRAPRRWSRVFRGWARATAGICSSSSPRVAVWRASRPRKATRDAGRRTCAHRALRDAWRACRAASWYYIPRRSGGSEVAAGSIGLHPGAWAGGNCHVFRPCRT
jgi:hypothetical protein